MKSSRKQMADKKITKKIWNDLGIEKVSRKHGFQLVRKALNTWVRFQAQNASLLKKKRLLEQEIAEIESKIS